ncbi:MAG: DUF177 domain-containing protein [Bacteroidales bacterium]
MKDLKAFKIPFKGLNLGSHQFEWVITKRFFELFENEDILNCQLQIHLEMDKTERMFALEFNITGTLEVECDRCLGNLIIPANIHEHYYIKLGHERKEESEEILIIPENEFEIDISEVIFDFIILSLPIKKVHGKDEKGNLLCDKETLAILHQTTIKKEIDPRWEVLKNFKLDNNN